jgi:hypothetical protein
VTGSYRKIKASDVTHTTTRRMPLQGRSHGRLPNPRRLFPFVEARRDASGLAAWWAELSVLQTDPVGGLASMLINTIERMSALTVVPALGEGLATDADVSPASGWSRYGHLFFASGGPR